MNKVKIGFFSFTEVTDASEHHAYNAWHQLDHLPEQLPLPGVAHGQRWVSTPACRAARAVASGPLAAVHYLTLYLMTDPVDATLENFFELGQRLHSLGRFHEHRRSHLSGPQQLLEAQVAPRVLVSPEALPFRPNHGIYVVVEEPDAEPAAAADLDRHVRWLHEHHVPRLLEVDGVAGVWSFATNPRLASRRWTAGTRRVTVCYLDGDPVTMAAALSPLLTERWRSPSLRPVYAGPLETIVPWHWDWFDGDDHGGNDGEK